MDSIDSIESSLTPGRGRGSTSPFSILLMTCRILLSAAPARASICFRVSLSALRISLSILRSASRCRGIAGGCPTVLEACTRFHPHVFARQLRKTRQIHAQDLGDAGYFFGMLHPELPVDLFPPTG